MFDRSSTVEKVIERNIQIDYLGTAIDKNSMLPVVKNERDVVIGSEEIRD